MKRLLSLALFSAIALAAASRPLLAAAPKADARSAALVAALQAVSPDPLGGRLGLTVASARAAEQAQDNRTVLGTDADRRAYAAWKGSKKA